MSFEDFWAEYPRLQGRMRAVREWDKLTMFEQQAAMDGLRLWKRSLDWKDLQFVPHASTFLHQQRWKELPIALKVERPDRGGTHQGGAIYSARDVEYYKQNGFKL